MKHHRHLIDEDEDEWRRRAELLLGIEPGNPDPDLATPIAKIRQEYSNGVLSPEREAEFIRLFGEGFLRPPQLPSAFPLDMSIEDLAAELPVKHVVSLAMVGTTAEDENAALTMYQRIRVTFAAEIAAGATPEQMAIMIATMCQAISILLLRGHPRWAEHFRSMGGQAFKPWRSPL
jgi:hypothetical protein